MNCKIRAVFDASTIRVYQAFNNDIADEAVALCTFGKSFQLNRMTWIKPSFLWMMYRSGWAAKENQTRILAIDMKREGFDFIVSNAVLSHFSDTLYESREMWEKLLQKSEIRCQWDPDRDIYGHPQEQRAIQLGIKGRTVKRYINEWIVRITDITPFVLETKQAIINRSFSQNMLPNETEYPYQ